MKELEDENRRLMMMHARKGSRRRFARRLLFE
jgi:hypothetical protein